MHGCKDHRCNGSARRGVSLPLLQQTACPENGRVVIHHFAHKPPILCDWARGETLAHLGAKRLVHAALTARGVKAELEYSVETLPGDRRGRHGLVAEWADDRH